MTRADYTRITSVDDLEEGEQYRHVEYTPDNVYWSIHDPDTDSGRKILEFSDGVVDVVYYRCSPEHYEFHVEEKAESVMALLGDKNA